MDFQFWIWLIIVVVTLLARALKKSPKAPDTAEEQPRTNPDRDESPDHKPMTFEELLREIQASKTPEKPKQIQQSRQVQQSRPIQQARPIQTFEKDYDDDIEEEEKSLETIPTKVDRSYEVYEKAKLDAFSRPSLKDTMKLEDTIMKFSHFKGYEDESSKSSLTKEILKDFKDPEGFRKAFIMSEILKRKF